MNAINQVAVQGWGTPGVNGMGMGLMPTGANGMGQMGMMPTGANGMGMMPPGPMGTAMLG